MIRHQVVSTLDPFLSSRQNDFREMVARSSLDETSRHQLHFIKRSRAWQTLGVPTVMQYGSIVPDDVRRAARSIFRGIMLSHRTLALHGLILVVDQRMVTVTSSAKATHFRRWGRLSRSSRRS